MAAFWKSLKDFVSLELHGAPFSIREDCTRGCSRAKDIVTVDEGVNVKESKASCTADKCIIEDPLDFMPKNSLKHMKMLPRHFEKLMCHSLCICMDSLLFEMTMMPLQAVGTFLCIIQNAAEMVGKTCRRHLSVLLQDIWISPPTHPGNTSAAYVTHKSTTHLMDNRVVQLQNTGMCEAKIKYRNCGNEMSSIGEKDNIKVNANVNGTKKIMKEETVMADHFVPYRRNGMASPPTEGVESCRDAEPMNTSEINYNGSKSNQTLSSLKPKDEESCYMINPSEACGLVRFLALIFAVFMLAHIDTSRVYHNIRGQPFIKLYVIFNMLEICEKLCRSFGRDCTDILMRSSIKLYKRFSNFTIRSQNMHEDLISAKSQEGVRISEEITENHIDQSYSKNAASHYPILEGSKSTGCLGSKNAVEHREGYLKNTSAESFHGSLDHKVLEGYENNNLVKPNGDTLPSEEIFKLSDKVMTNINNNRDTVHYGKDEQLDMVKGSNIIGNCKRNTWGSSIIVGYTNDISSYSNCDTKAAETSHNGESWNSGVPVLCMRFLLVVIYVIFHSFMHLIRVLSLNIAINSSDSAMFLLLVTNNFAEIKTTVFKKYNETSLFTIVATDAVERFHLCFDAMLVFFKMSTVECPLKSYITVSRWLIKMLILEVIIDYFKHSFLLKFNRIRGDIFKRYSEVLIGDVLLSRCQRKRKELVNFNFRVMCKGAYSFSHISSWRLGFMSTPMLTLIVCNVPYMRNGLTMDRFISVLCIWLSLLFLKITTSILLVAYAIKNHKGLQSLHPPMDTISAL